MDPYNIKVFSERLKNSDIESDINIMEVCGTHTTEFFRTGVKDIFPERLNLVDGPGCPVCVTPNEFLDHAIEISKKHGTIITTFGDMMRVPSSYSSLQREKAEGLDIRVVYSTLDAINIAKEIPEKEVIFLSVGFETTIPTQAVAVKHAKENNIKNFSILGGNKLTPPAVKALLDLGEVNIEGFILPGHVSTITGVKAWRFIPDDYSKASVIAGFESRDLVTGTMILLDLIKKGKGKIVNEYRRAVTEEGNTKAQELMLEVFELCESKWRGIGIIPGSGLRLRENYRDFDAAQRFPVSPPPSREHAGCRCGEVLRGLISPLDCPLFGTECTPQSPLGACMVSSEGSCAAYHKYRRF